MKLYTFISTWCAVFLLFSCQSNKPQVDIQQIANDYYQVYQEREDFQHFLNYYDEQIILEDIITADRKVGKAAFAEFFDWDNPAFSKVEENALEIEQLIVDGNRVVSKGYFTPFRWNEHQFPAMYFTTILTFNDAGKIIKQIDWVNYPSNLVDYSKRKDANEWIDKKQ